MFDSYLNDLIENRVMNDQTIGGKNNTNITTTSGSNSNNNNNNNSPSSVNTSNKSSPLIKSSQTSRGLKDLINHPPSKINLNNNDFSNSVGGVGGSGSSCTNSSVGTPQLNKKSTTGTTTTSSIKFANRKDQSLRELLEDWRTDFYPNLSYDHFNENTLNSQITGTNKKYDGNNSDGDDDDDDDGDDDDDDDGDDDDDDENNHDEGDEDNINEEDDNNSNEDDEDDTTNNSNNNPHFNAYHEYINSTMNSNNENDKNKNNNNNNINNKQESLLEQRVKQWKNDVLSDISQSSEMFMELLPQRIFEKPHLSNNSELPMTPSTKREVDSPTTNNISNSNNNNNNRSKFENWRESFNNNMDEKMKEKKRTNKITITSNK